MRGSVKISSLSVGEKEIVFATFNAGEERSADATAMTECEPQGFFAGPRGSRRSLYDPSQNPLPSAATDDRAGRERVVPASRVAGRQSIAAARREGRSARPSQSFGRTARLAARARQHGGREPGEREQDLPELVSPGPDQSRQGLDYDPQRGSHRALI